QTYLGACTPCRPKQENHRSQTTEVERRALHVQRTHHPHLVLRCSSPPPPLPRHQHRDYLQRTSCHLHRSLPIASRDQHTHLVH
ncbi:hypothetical protein IscW_ISCW013785, partial [Ixodes scapularis]